MSNIYLNTEQQSMQPTDNQIIIEITLGKVKPTIVGGVVYFNNEELKKCF